MIDYQNLIHSIYCTADSTFFKQDICDIAVFFKKKPFSRSHCIYRNAKVVKRLCQNDRACFEIRNLKPGRLFLVPHIINEVSSFCRQKRAQLVSVNMPVHIVEVVIRRMVPPELDRQTVFGEITLSNKVSNLYNGSLDFNDFLFDIIKAFLQRHF